MPGIIEVAREAGVSKSTVSRVLNNNGPVDQKTREVVLAAMQRLNFSPNVFARGMRTNRSRSIGILFPDISNPFFIDWFRFAESAARQRGYMLYICITDEHGDTESGTIQDLLARSIDGIVFFSYQRNEEVLSMLRKVNSNTPVIFTDPDSYSDSDAYIFTDGHQGTYQAVSYLIGTGKKRIAFIKGGSRFTVTEDRYQGYLKAMKDQGFMVDEAMVVEGDFHNENGYDAARRLLALRQMPDAIVSATDAMALGALRYLNEKGFNIPDDVAIIGFDDLSLSSISVPPLSTIAMDIEGKAVAAINYLIDKIGNPDAPPVQLVFKPKLVIRQSTGAVSPLEKPIIH